jgi:hypothetical protein
MGSHVPDHHHWAKPNIVLYRGLAKKYLVSADVKPSVDNIWETWGRGAMNGPGNINFHVLLCGRLQIERYE